MTIINGDALNVFPGLDSDSFDAVIADPPYSSGGAMRADRNTATSQKYRNTGAVSELPEFAGDSRGQWAFLIWSRLWMAEAWRVTKPGGWLMVFTDWRQFAPTLTAVEAAGWSTRGVVVWVKPAGRPYPNRFKNNAEYVVTATKGAHPFDHDDADYPDGVWSGSAPNERVHITQKPVGLIRHLMRVVPAGGRVLDPFAGSGTTLEAGQLSGLDVVGIELLDEWATYAQERVAQLPLFTGRDI